MKRRILSVLMVFAMSLTLAACGSSATKEAADKVYQKGEAAYIYDETGNEMYSLIINSVKVATDYNNDNFAKANQKQILEVDYTYKNIAKDDEHDLEINSSEILVADVTGTVTQYSFYYPKLMPEVIPPGMQCNVQAYYGAATVNDKVTISFTSKSFGQTLKFEIPVE